MWFGPFIIKEVLKKGAYHLVIFEGNALAEPRNVLHVKIAQLDKCRMSLSIVVSVASSLQLSQVSQVGH
jgi:hypothetical protein